MTVTSNDGTSLSLDRQKLYEEFPHVPFKIINWVVENVPDPKDVKRGLASLNKGLSEPAVRDKVDLGVAAVKSLVAVPTSD